jgi:hypothetical protein
MAKSGELRVEEVQAALQLVGECRDLRYDPQQWGQHMSEGVCRLVGARAANGGEVGFEPSQGVMQGATYFDAGFERREHDLFLEFLRTHGIYRHPLAAGFAKWRAARPLPCQVAALTRRQVIPDREWYRSVAYEQYHRPIRIDHCLGSTLELLSDRWFSCIILHRTVGEPDFSERQRRLLHLFHAELGRLIGLVLVSARDPFSPTKLPTRVWETLQCLLDGDSEKQAAARMRLSRETVHQYVKALYRHFGVSSRAELLAHFIRRPSLPAEHSERDQRPGRPI